MNTLRTHVLLSCLSLCTLHAADSGQHPLITFNLATGGPSHVFNPTVSQKDFKAFKEWQEQREQTRLKLEEARQQETLGHAQHRTMSLSSPIASAPQEEFTMVGAPSPRTHKKQRSISDPAIVGAYTLATASSTEDLPIAPGYSFIDTTQSVDELLEYGNKTLQTALNAFTQLAENMSKQLHERTNEYRVQSTTNLMHNTAHQPKTLKQRGLKVLQRVGIYKEKLRTQEGESTLEQCIHDDTKQREAAKLALVPLLVSIGTIAHGVEKMGKKIEDAANRTEKRQEKLRDRTPSHSSPRISRTQVAPTGSLLHQSRSASSSN